MTYSEIYRHRMITCTLSQNGSVGYAWSCQIEGLHTMDGFGRGVSNMRPDGGKVVAEAIHAARKEIDRAMRADKAQAQSGFS
jgi:hypothetical protein